MRRQRPAVQLSKRVVDAFECPPGRKDALLFDGNLTGFAVRATSAGRKVFLLQYKRAGRVVRLVLGEYGALTVEQARVVALQARGRAAGGHDPKAEIREAERAAEEARLEAERVAEEARLEAERQAKVAAFTFEDLIDRWHDDHLEPNRSPRYAAEAKRALHGSFPGWLSRPAVEIVSKEVTERLKRLRQSSGPAAALHAFRYGHAAYAWAQRAELVTVNPFAKAMAPEPLEDRERALSDEELGCVWRASQQLGHPFAGLVGILILTLQRRGEVSGMAWAELSPDFSQWAMAGARTKNKRAHIVHLAPEARAIIAAQPRFADCPFVFSTAGKAKVSGFSKAKSRLDALIKADRRKAGLKPVQMAPWHLHDLRRTGVSTMARLGVPADVADRILNHQASATNGGVKGIYQQYDYGEERAEALRRWARHVAEAAQLPSEPEAGARPSAKVVQLRPRKGQASQP